MVVQGESERASDNVRLGMVALHDLPAHVRGDVPIEVTFSFGADGILDVSAREVTTGKSAAARIEARPTVDPAHRSKLAAQEKAYQAEQRGKADADRLAALKDLVERAENLMPKARAASGSVAGVGPALERAGATILAARSAAESGDPGKVMTLVSDLSNVVDSLKLLAGTGSRE